LDTKALRNVIQVGSRTLVLNGAASARLVLHKGRHVLAVTSHVVDVELLLGPHWFPITRCTRESLRRVGILGTLGVRRFGMIGREVTQPRRALDESLVAVVARVRRRVTVLLFDVIEHCRLLDTPLVARGTDVLARIVLGVATCHGDNRNNRNNRNSRNNSSRNNSRSNSKQSSGHLGANRGSGGRRFNFLTKVAA